MPAHTRPIRPKTLVIGTGFHRQVLGNCENILTSWHALLEAVAKKKELPHSCQNEKNPTHFWELLVEEFINKKNQQVAAAKAEKMLKKTAAELLQDEATSCPRPDNLAESLNGFHGYILNLNFDHVLDEMLGAEFEKFSATTRFPKLGSLSASMRHNLFARSVDKAPSRKPVTIWHPHGSIKSPETMRLGLRDYGLLPSAINTAFQTFKEWEREVCKGDDKKPMTDAQYGMALEALEALDKNPSDTRPRHDHWVTRFMLSDITIIGAGLQDSEIGLHWLLCQRQRNFNRIDATHRPETKYLTVDTRPCEFFTTRKFPDWKAAWKSI